MASLAEIQALFWRAIVHPTGVARFLAEADPETVARFEEVFVSTSAFAAVDRVDVYADSYYWRLHGVLETQFPTVAWLLGAVAFRNLTTDYVLARPSTAPDIGRFGAGFVPYLETHDVGQAAPHVVAIARVEWTIVEVLDARDEPPLEPTALAELPVDAWPTLRLVPARTTRLLASPWSYPAIARLCREGGAVADAPLEAGRCHTLVWRQEHAVRHRSVSAPEAAALTAALSGRPFADQCAAASEVDGSLGPAQVVGWLRGWLDACLFTAAASGEHEPE
ncbi:MAG: putative DNA-binding domain-containing protein [Myxococcales bacterium]|nr:putative DNA-binding domain-containing protein [Myxococcales bacterium]